MLVWLAGMAAGGAVCYTKSMTGHLLVAEAISTVLALHHQVVPPTTNLLTLDEAIDPRLDLTLHKPQHRALQVAMSNSFGFGGQNCTLVMQRYVAP